MYATVVLTQIEHALGYVEFGDLTLAQRLDNAITLIKVLQAKSDLQQEPRDIGAETSAKEQHQG